MSSILPKNERKQVNVRYHSNACCNTLEGLDDVAHAHVLDNSRIGKLLASSKMATIINFLIGNSEKGEILTWNDNSPSGSGILHTDPHKLLML